MGNIMYNVSCKKITKKITVFKIFKDVPFPQMAKIKTEWDLIVVVHVEVELMKLISKFARYNCLR